MRCFDLEIAEFSEGSEEEITLPDKSSLEMYNRQYYLLFNEAKQFFADCKDAISRLMALNTLGFGFNLPLIIGSFISMENNSCAANKNNQQNELKKKQRQKYEKSFHGMLSRMGQLVYDLINLEVEIKRNYMGLYVKPTPLHKKHRYGPENNSFISDGSGSSSDLLRRKLKQCIIKEEVEKEQEKQEKIRDLLKKNANTHTEQPKPACQIKTEPTQNLDRLNDKIEAIRKKIKEDREKEERVWDSFNKKKPSNQQYIKPTPSTKKKGASLKILEGIMSEQSIQHFQDDLEETASIRTKNTIQSILEPAFQF